MFSATDESEYTDEITDLAETSTSAAPFDVCELSLTQQLFLCDQAAKYKHLSYRLNFDEYTYRKCEAHFPSWPKFLWFQCPPLIVISENGEFAFDAEFFIYLSGTHEPAKALAFSYYPDGDPDLYASAWMESIDLDILEKVADEPGEFEVNNLDVLTWKITGL